MLRYTLPCEMFVLKNRCAPELSEVNAHARLNHSKQLLQNILRCQHRFCSLTKTLTVAVSKNPQNDQPHAHPSSKKKDVATKHLHTQHLVIDDIS